MKSDPAFAVDSLTTRLRRRTIYGSFNCAMETLQLLRVLVSHGRWNNVQALIALLKDAGREIVNAQPTELSTGNVIRRLLHLIREECTALMTEDDQNNAHGGDMKGTVTAMYHLLSDLNARKIDYGSAHAHDMKPHFIQLIKELLDDIDSVYTNISNQSVDHIHSNEIIMTTGKSKTVEEFLKAAHRKRKFQVIVAEMSPLYSGHDMAVSLSKAGIETTLITDASIYAVMSRVNKVILGAHAILANGGLIAVSGSHAIAAAAKFHHTPVVVCSGIYKLSPLQPSDERLFSLCSRPNGAIEYQDELMNKVDVVSPFFDYVSPDYIDLFVTNLGGHAPSYIYRLLNENYDPEDYRLE